MKFNALSYVWGDSNDTTAITVSGLKVFITRSLAGALENLRDCMTSSHTMPTEFLSDDQLSLTIWADAICINQEDRIERSHQVQMMGQIYATASNVIAWLGEGNKHTDFSFDFMNRGPQAMAEQKETPEKLFKVEVVLKQILCKRPWWRRLSEIVKGAYFVMCFLIVLREWDLPHLSSLWSKVWKEVIDVTSVDSNTVTPSTNLSAITSTGIHPISLDRVRETFRENQAKHPEFGTQSAHPISLPYAIRYVMSNSEATDPRDYIYGLLGLLDHSVRNNITVDYDIEPMELFQQVSYILWSSQDVWTAEYSMPALLPLLEFRNQPELLEAEEGRAPANSYYKYPSWVPDFSIQPIRGWKDYLSLLADRPLSFPLHWDKRPPASPNSPTIVLQGIALDTIKISIATPQDFTRPDDLVPFLLDVEAQMKDAINKPIPVFHRLSPLTSLKHIEEVVYTLTRNKWLPEPLLPGLDDEEVWDILVGGKPASPSPSPLPSFPNSPSLNPTNSQRDSSPSDWDPDSSRGSLPDGDRDKMLTRTSTALRGKFLSRRILITETGFVGIGVRQIRDGDLVAFPFGCSCPLVLRPCADPTGVHVHLDGGSKKHYRIGGCAYVSGLMETEELERVVELAVLEVEEFRIC